jgi:ABC-2 type transport system ATP-binding protein
VARAAVVTDAPVVAIEHLVKRYARHQAVRDVSLAVPRGRIYGLIGPDGAGKSSVMKAVAGILTVDGGRVRVFDVALDSERAAERIKPRLGFMPQGLGLNLYPELSVEENVDVFAQLRLVPPATLAARKASLLGLTRLAPFRERPMKQLSGGMKQKLGLVCTLIHQPELIILDEPTTGVDPVSRRDFWVVLAELIAEAGITALVSTAYMDEATRFHRVAFMYGGRILAEGEPDALRARVPRTRTDEPDLEDVFAWLLRDEPGLTAPAPRDEASRAVAPPARDTAARDGTVIEARGLTRDFGRFRAVDDVSLRVHAGEVFGLLGANGAGKTTVVKMLTGILRPTAGLAMMAGCDMRRAARAVKQRLGYVSQAFSLYHDLTAVENVRLSAGIYGLVGEEARRRTEWALALGGLAGREDMLAARLPMGVRQRLALACALVHHPQALFLDEPTAGVDPIGRQRFWDVLFTLARDEGVAILVTTHYMAEAERCDRLALMFAGRLVADAPPADLKREVETEAGRALEITPDDPARALVALTAAGFAGAAPWGGHIRLLSRDPRADEASVRAALGAARIAVRGVTVRPLTMEEVFVHRVTALERAAAGAAGRAA